MYKISTSILFTELEITYSGRSKIINISLVCKIDQAIEIAITLCFAFFFSKYPAPVLYEIKMYTLDTNHQK